MYVSVPVVPSFNERQRALKSSALEVRLYCHSDAKECRHSLHCRNADIWLWFRAQKSTVARYLIEDRLRAYDKQYRRWLFRMVTTKIGKSRRPITLREALYRNARCNY